MVPCPAVRKVALLLLVTLAACRKNAEVPAAPRPSILLVTLDTTRFDAIGQNTPSFTDAAKRGRFFRQAYCAVPQTLASHSSMLTGVYPAAHGIHENGRYLNAQVPLLAEKLHAAGYRTIAFVSAFALAKRFGLSRGFDVYDDDFAPGTAERPARETTDRALPQLSQQTPQPLFLWVHYYDPHFPYTPPEPYRSRFATNPYLGEVASMDEQLGRLLKAFRTHAGENAAIIIVADHGEGLGEHGEQQHGNLLYQSTMHVPLLIAGPGVAAGTSDTPVSTRRVFQTILDFAGIDATNSLRGESREVVVAEAMKPFLDYGWQPQVMALENKLKTISAGGIEVYDVIADPAETHNLASTANLSREVRAALRDYPIPSPAEAAATSATSDEERKKLASLGYVAATARPVVRKDAPRPADMAPLFPILDQAAGLFVREQYAASIPLFEKIIAADPDNLDAILHLATAYSTLGNETKAVETYRKAQSVAPDSPDVRTYLGLHYARSAEWPKAVPLLERVVADDPDRLPAVEGLAVVREKQGRAAEAIQLWQKVFSMRAASPEELVRLGELAMNSGNAAVAIDAFEKAHSDHDLELGVVYLAAHRLEDARAALDRGGAPPPAYAMALFKRAQVSVLLREPDAPARIEAARQHADATTRELIARERLFR
jgi:arylsulfatase A-like enzyme/Tfp pilus assembly protein PilF